MSSSINRVVLLGNLTKDPEAVGNSDSPICKMRIAVNDRVKADDGSWQDRPNFFNLTAFGSTAEHCLKYLAKGRQIAVDGKLRQRQYEDRDGNKREAVEVIAQTVQFVGKRDDGTDGTGEARNAASGRTGANPATFAGDAQDAFAAAGIDTTAAADDDTDIPF